MNRYGVTINNHAEVFQEASSAHTAVDRAMERHIEGEFKPCAIIKVRFCGKLEKTWYVVAEVPYDYGENGKGYTRQRLAEGIVTEKQACIQVRELEAAHPDYKHVRTGWMYSAHKK